MSTPIPTPGPRPATALVLSAIDDSLVFFYTPTDLAEKDIPKDRRMRIGGLVAENSVKRAADALKKSGQWKGAPAP